MRGLDKGGLDKGFYGIKYEPYENELANDHSNIVEHQIDNPELFNDPYPLKSLRKVSFQTLQRNL